MIFDQFIKKRTVYKNESSTRSLIKTISWRVVGTIDTVIISFFLTGKLDIALSIGSVEIITKMILYYLHERVWNRIIIR